MDIIIGSARIDENGNTNGGNAGDQKQEIQDLPICHALSGTTIRQEVI